MLGAVLPEPEPEPASRANEAVRALHRAAAEESAELQ